MSVLYVTPTLVVRHFLPEQYLQNNNDNVTYKRDGFWAINYERPNSAYSTRRTRMVALSKIGEE